MQIEISDKKIEELIKGVMENYNPGLTVDKFKKMVTADYGVTEFKVIQ